MSIEDVGFYSSSTVLNRHVKGREHVEPVRSFERVGAGLRQLPRVKPVGLKCKKCIGDRDDAPTLIKGRNRFDNDEKIQNRMHSNVDVEYSKSNVQAKPIGATQKMTSAQSLKSAIDASSKPVVVLFYSDNCHFCHEFKPVYEKLSNHPKLRNNMKFYAIEARKMSQDDFDMLYGIEIHGYPTIVMFYEGRIEYIENREDPSEYARKLDMITEESEPIGYRDMSDDDEEEMSYGSPKNQKKPWKANQMNKMRKRNATRMDDDDSDDSDTFMPPYSKSEEDSDSSSDDDFY